MKTRIQYIDRLKGLAMLFVVMGHLVCFTMYDSWDMAAQDYILDIVSTFHMPLFMFLSGLVITEPPAWRKLGQKLPRFMMPFITFGTLYVLVAGLTLGYFWTDNFKAGYWYLWVLSIFYGLLALFKIRNVSGGWQFATSVIIYLCMRGAAAYLPGEVAGILSLTKCIDMWPFFILGYFCNMYHVIGQKLNNTVFTVALIGFIPLYVLFHNNIVHHLVQSLSLCAIIILVYLFREREHEVSNVEQFLSFVGRNSLDVYIIQYFMFRIINMKVLAEWLRSTNNYLFEVLLVIAVAAIVSTICVYIGKILRHSNFLHLVCYGHRK